MSTRPAIDRTDHDFESEALVVRTDFSDDEARRATADLLNQPRASPDEVVLSTIAGDPELGVMFLADAAP